MFNNTTKTLLRLGYPKYAFLFRPKHQEKRASEKSGSKSSAEIINYLETNPEYRDIKDRIPKHLLKKYRSPESMYLINTKMAKEIAKTLQSHLTNEKSPVVEVNPGFGFLTKELLDYLEHIHLFEISGSFVDFINDLKKQHPKRISYKVADFFGMWKLAFQDKMDNGNRMGELLGDLATNEDRTVKIIGAMPSLSFVKHILTTIIFHNTTNQLGRPDLYMVIPGHHYEFLTDSSERRQTLKTLPSLFQLLFDYKLLSKIPIAHYLPWFPPPDNKRANVIHENYLYLVNIRQKDVLPCSPEYLPLMWYFFRPHMISKSTRLIPLLEQWVPGCGVRLITGQDPAESRTALGPGPDDPPLPHVNIFTVLGDLTLGQKLTVFKRFISWPEFDQCPFRVTMENNLPKYITAYDGDGDGDKKSIAIDEDDGDEALHDDDDDIDEEETVRDT